MAQQASSSATRNNGIAFFSGISGFMGSSFLFPAALILRLHVWKRRRTLARKVPSPDSDPFSDGEFGKNLSCSSSTVGGKRESPIQVPQTPSAFHPPVRQNAFRRDARRQIQIVRPRNQSLRRFPNSSRLR